ncbi:helix-turn-helix transcriptional regulator [Paenibacillus wynnii]|uniref:XRE family transcriptional regulator n=1 Tax=Paenibacillus wynnii TaxID=268407 RepID=A0A098M6E2_9BACL|nr:helix-turn-helix transcriptional regulator [Paenibacillus wynnii]KGE17603.1 XRE family transcriptional regulator [Paenibacillus wynnii]
MKEVIAKRLLALRSDSSREETAQAIGISVSALQMYENAQRVPRDEIKVKIANHYKSSVQSIFFDPEPHNSCSCDEQIVTKEVG